MRADEMIANWLDAKGVDEFAQVVVKELLTRYLPPRERTPSRRGLPSGCARRTTQFSAV